ncbi:MAG: hypothetical protein J0I16_06205 [Rhizobiales bacterium]|nr:hypothetical protein [Hyphomicrobiales bacterium]
MMTLLPKLPRTRYGVILLVLNLAIDTSVSAGAQAQTAAVKADQNGVVQFTTPSNNIECIYVPAGGSPVYKPPGNMAELSCDRAAPSYVRIQMSARGTVQQISNPGDQPCCSVGPVLNYGETWRLAPFSCTSERTGLTCRRDDGHGFSVSRAGIKRY